MVRAPCCEKMGLKRGPWTPDEDDVLVSYIQKHGHGNWRALPKQAGLLRCGKSCRLRWTNYLRPDIKRGNYSKEEEDTIISLHEMLGNRWSVIAARLPGRTDNEIKNVWHTHLKKRVKQNHEIQESKPKARCKAEHEMECNPRTSQLGSYQEHLRFNNTNLISVSGTHSYSEFSCSGTNSSTVTGENYSAAVKEERIDSSEEIPEIYESFWSEALSMQNSTESADLKTFETSSYDLSSDPSCPFSTSSEDMSFWLRIFMEAGDAQDLPDI